MQRLASNMEPLAAQMEAPFSHLHGAPVDLLVPRGRQVLRQPVELPVLIKLPGRERPLRKPWVLGKHLRAAMLQGQHL